MAGRPVMASLAPGRSPTALTSPASSQASELMRGLTAWQRKDASGTVRSSARACAGVPLSQGSQSSTLRIAGMSAVAV